MHEAQFRGNVLAARLRVSESLVKAEVPLAEMPGEKLEAFGLGETRFDLTHHPRPEAAPSNTRMHDEPPGVARAILQNTPHRPHDLITELRGEYPMRLELGKKAFQTLGERRDLIVVV